ncbi:MAG: hypothetical protein ACTSSH_04925 [Candidatus Heimdallarchaeota archaeon]
MSEEEQLQICFSCNTKNPKEEDFCSNCGFKLRKEIKKKISQQKNISAAQKQKSTLTAVVILLILVTPFTVLTIRSNIYSGVVLLTDFSYDETEDEFTIMFYCANGSSILKSIKIGIDATQIISYFIEEKYHLKMKDSQYYTITIDYVGTLPSKLYLNYDCYTHGPILLSFSVT